MEKPGGTKETCDDLPSRLRRRRNRVLMGGLNHTGCRAATQKHNNVRENGARSAEASL
jgi:hypothetical protein